MEVDNREQDGKTRKNDEIHGINTVNRFRKSAIVHDFVHEEQLTVLISLLLPIAKLGNNDYI